MQQTELSQFYINAQSRHYQNVMKPFGVNNISDPLREDSAYWSECWLFVARGNEKAEGEGAKSKQKELTV
jgi:hypothetical protein